MFYNKNLLEECIVGMTNVAVRAIRWITRKTKKHVQALLEEMVQQ